jgi:hypothetical protein
MLSGPAITSRSQRRPNRVKTNLLGPQAMVKDHPRTSSQMSHKGFATRAWRELRGS